MTLQGHYGLRYGRRYTLSHCFCALATVATGTRARVHARRHNAIAPIARKSLARV